MRLPISMANFIQLWMFYAVEMASTVEFSQTMRSVLCVVPYRCATAHARRHEKGACHCRKLILHTYISRSVLIRGFAHQRHRRNDNAFHSMTQRKELLSQDYVNSLRNEIENNDTWTEKPAQLMRIGEETNDMDNEYQCDVQLTIDCGRGCCCCCCCQRNKTI